MKVELVGHTVFTVPDVSWFPDSTRSYVRSDPDDPALFNGEDLIEFAGRACYQSWNRPNPATATNAGYLAHLLDVGHYSVLEHASASFYITGISRSLTHEFVRHRLFSYSQLSQRYVKLGPNAEWVTPPELEDDPEAFAAIDELLDHVHTVYDELVKIMERKLADVEDRTERRKRARQAARCVLPNMAETKVVVTGNYRSWIHFVNLRASVHADVEIRRLAVEILRQLQEHVAPAVFNHFKIIQLEDGTEAAEGPVVT